MKTFIALKVRLFRTGVFRMPRPRGRRGGRKRTQLARDYTSPENELAYYKLTVGYVDKKVFCQFPQNKISQIVKKILTRVILRGTRGNAVATVKKLLLL